MTGHNDRHQVVLLWDILNDVVDGIVLEKFFCVLDIGYCNRCPVAALSEDIQGTCRRLLVLIDLHGFDRLILDGHHEFLVGHLLAE